MVKTRHCYCGRSGTKIPCFTVQPKKTHKQTGVIMKMLGNNGCLEWQWRSQLQSPDPPPCLSQSLPMSLERQASLSFGPGNDSLKASSDLGQIVLVEHMLCASSFTCTFISLSSAYYYGTSQAEVDRMVEYTSTCNHPTTSTVTNSWQTSLHTSYLQMILKQTPAIISWSVSISCISSMYF